MPRWPSPTGALAVAVVIVISTAAVPGRKAPTLITVDMVERMPPGSVRTTYAGRLWFSEPRP